MMVGNKLEKQLKAGNFVCTMELIPPEHNDPAKTIEKARESQIYFEAFNVSDNRSSVTMSSIAMGKLLLDAGIEPIIHMTCRDRNRISIQSDILGASALGIKNVLCLTGEHQILGNLPSAKNVYDMDSIQLIQMLDGLRKGCFQNEEKIKEKRLPELFLGCVENPFAEPLELRIMRLEKKIKAGADFLQTKCIEDMDTFKRFMDKVVELGIHERIFILAGINKIEQINELKQIKGVAGAHLIAG